MGAFFINSISVSRITSLSMNGSLLKNNQQQKKNIMVCYCQGSSSCSSNSGAGNVKTTSSNNGLPASSSSMVTDHRSSLLPMPKTDYGTAAALIDSESFVLTPNGKIPSQAVSYNTPSAADISSVHDHEGIGIVSFLRGKRFLITGATGFLAKVLIEKILRTVPDVGKIFLLIKAKDKEAAVERLENEIISTELFKCLEETYGESYQTFMLSKLIPVLGNVCESNLGIEPELADQIANEVDIIVNSAANTTFDERYDVALDINTRGPYRLMTFAKTCKKLQLFLQVSTAYVNGQRQGRVMEKPFCIGESIASESRKPTAAAAAAGTLPMLDVEAEIKLAMESREGFQDNLVTQKMKDLGLERARTYGWQDTYVFTKAMGEMMIDKMRGEIPVAIIRPSVIESTYNEPFPGWMEGNRMMDPIVLYYGKGQLTGFLVDPQGVLDVVPADMVVNAILAAMAKHGRKDVKAAATAAAGINIYQIASSVVNPLVFQDLSKLLYEHFSSLPYMDSRGMPIQVPEMKLFSSMDDFSSHIWTESVHRCGGSSSSSTTTTTTASAISSTSDGTDDVIFSSLHGKKKQLSKRSLEMVCKKSVEQAKYLANIYEPYTFYGGRFDNSNAQKLMEAMSDEESRSFGFDVGSINWKDYISNVHIPGLRRHVMKGRGMFG